MYFITNTIGVVGGSCQRSSVPLPILSGEHPLVAKRQEFNDAVERELRKAGLEDAKAAMRVPDHDKFEALFAKRRDRYGMRKHLKASVRRLRGLDAQHRDMPRRMDTIFGVMVALGETQPADVWESYVRPVEAAESNGQAAEEPTGDGPPAVHVSLPAGNSKSRGVEARVDVVPPEGVVPQGPIEVTAEEVDIVDREPSTDHLEVDPVGTPGDHEIATTKEAGQARCSAGAGAAQPLRTSLVIKVTLMISIPVAVILTAFAFFLPTGSLPAQTGDPVECLRILASSKQRETLVQVVREEQVALRSMLDVGIVRQFVKQFEGEAGIDLKVVSLGGGASSSSAEFQAQRQREARDLLKRLSLEAIKRVRETDPQLAKAAIRCMELVAEGRRASAPISVVAKRQGDFVAAEIRLHYWPREADFPTVSNIKTSSSLRVISTPLYAGKARSLRPGEPLLVSCEWAKRDSWSGLVTVATSHGDFSAHVTRQVLLSAHVNYSVLVWRDTKRMREQGTTPNMHNRRWPGGPPTRDAVPAPPHGKWMAWRTYHTLQLVDDNARFKSPSIAWLPNQPSAGWASKHSVQVSEDGRKVHAEVRNWSGPVKYEVSAMVQKLVPEPRKAPAAANGNSVAFSLPEGAKNPELVLDTNVGKVRMRLQDLEGNGQLVKNQNAYVFTWGR